MKYVPFITLLAVASVWAGSQEKPKDKDPLVEQTKTMLKLASAEGSGGLYRYMSFAQPDENAVVADKRLGKIRKWANSLRDMEEDRKEHPERYGELSYKSFEISRNRDDKGNPLPSITIRFNIPPEAQFNIIPHPVKAIEWTLVFETNPAGPPAKGDPVWLLVGVERQDIPAARPGLLYTL